MDDDLDALVRRVDPDRWLSSRFIGDAQARADVVALYAYDHELARAPKVASNPLLGEIRLTWWREVLDEAYEGRHVRHHPTAQALAAAIARRSLPRAPLEAMIDARYRELDAAPMDEAEALEWARGTGGQAAEAAVRILDPAADPARAAAAGAVWMLGRGEPKPGLGAVAAAARADARALSAAAFPAVAHATLALHPARSELGRRLRLTWAVAIGRI
ncbi:MAG: squalene/phytoene synthase family protein [Caulobacterales bacterium]|nr:squalene/phytoene synthase family protein [Caulobacterales bacterium]